MRKSNSWLPVNGQRFEFEGTIAPRMYDDPHVVLMDVECILPTGRVPIRNVQVFKWKVEPWRNLYGGDRCRFHATVQDTGLAYATGFVYARTIRPTQMKLAPTKSY